MSEKPVLLDANAALRYLLEDNDEQTEEVCRAVASGAEVTLEVLAECVYVLSCVYEVPRSRVAESLDLKSAGQTVAAGHHNAADGVMSDMLGYFHDPHVFIIFYRNGQRVIDPGQMVLGELNVHDGTGDLYDLSFFKIFQIYASLSLRLRRSALAPLVTSVISCVITL